MMATTMTPSEAWGYAASWGSYMTAGDPGACMYGFDHNCRPQSEEHRQDVLRHMAKCRETVVNSRPGDYPDNELEQLDAFVEFITHRSIEPENDPDFDLGITFQNGNLCEIGYDDVVKAIKETDSNPFNMSIRCNDEWAAIAAAVNQGIDSHLEAISNASEEFDNGDCNVTPHNLCILLRRLGEGPFDTDELWDSAHTIQSDILTVLGFDDCGKYVGRKAMGLD